MSDKHRLGLHAKTRAIDDLRVLLTEYSSTMPEYISPLDIYKYVVEVFTQYVKPVCQGNTLVDLFNWKKPEDNVGMDEFVDRMLAQIGCIEVEGVIDLDIIDLLTPRFGTKKEVDKEAIS